MSKLFWMRALVLIMVIFTLTGCNSTINVEKKQILTEFEAEMQNLLDAWYPVSIDTVYGGYISDLSFEWKPRGRQNKMLVSQARHVWTSSQAAMFTGNDYYQSVAEHGFHYLRDVMWDEEYGGFYLTRDQKGNPVQSFFADAALDEKTAYGMAFAIYALSSYYEMCGDKEALDLAIETFNWLEKHSYDPQYGGYVNQLTREGEWYGKAGMYKDTKRGLARDNKDQNTSIHIMEAFTQLYMVWPDEHLKTRLNEMLEIIRDKIVDDKGYLTLYMELDWTPISYRDSSKVVREANYYTDHVSFGHDVETAYLMLETAHVLGIKDNTKTLKVAKRMVDHCLANGMDEAVGGIYYEGYYFDDVDTCTIINNGKEWWVQAEGCNAFLLMHNLYPNENEYYDAFKSMWTFINAYQIDKVHGGWYSSGLDKNPRMAKANKGGIWKANYHNYRALMNCIKMLRGNYELADIAHSGDH